jgi:hypothetical protein
LATVPTATDRLFMDGESDAAAVSVALTVREAVRRQRRQASRRPVARPSCSTRHWSTTSRSATASCPASAIRRRSTCSSVRARFQLV